MHLPKKIMPWCSTEQKLWTEFMPSLVVAMLGSNSEGHRHAFFLCLVLQPAWSFPKCAYWIQHCCPTVTFRTKSCHLISLLLEPQCATSQASSSLPAEIFLSFWSALNNTDQRWTTLNNIDQRRSTLNNIDQYWTGWIVFCWLLWCLVWQHISKCSFEVKEGVESMQIAWLCCLKHFTNRRDGYQKSG